MTFKARIKNIFLAFVFLFVWVGIASFIYSYVYGGSLAQEIDFKSALLGGCMITPLWEELYYRFVPISIGKALGQAFILPAVVLSSISFGFAHGNPPLYHLLVQGVMGVVFSWVYIKNRYSYWSSVLLHSLWNAFVYFGVPYLAGLF